jgi:hypothetical protein
MSCEAEFAKRLGVLAEVFAESLSPMRVAGYWAALSDLEPVDVYAAMDHALKTSRFFPRPGEVREHAEALADKRRERERQDKPVVPHYRRLEAGDVPVSAQRIAQFLAEMRQMIRSMPELERRPHREKRR